MCVCVCVCVCVCSVNFVDPYTSKWPKDRKSVPISLAIKAVSWLPKQDLNYRWKLCVTVTHRFLQEHYNGSDPYLLSSSLQRTDRR